MAFSWVLIDVGEPSWLWALPALGRWIGRYEKGSWASLGEQEAVFLCCSCSCSFLSSWLWHVSQTSPFPPHVAFGHSVYHSDGKQSRPRASDLVKGRRVAHLYEFIDARKEGWTAKDGELGHEGYRLLFWLAFSCSSCFLPGPVRNNGRGVPCCALSPS